MMGMGALPMPIIILYSIRYIIYITLTTHRVAFESESERRGTMNKIRIPCKIRMFCPACGKELQTYMLRSETTNGTAYTHRAFDVCPHCEVELGRTTSVNGHSFISTPTVECKATIRKTYV